MPLGYEQLSTTTQPLIAYVSLYRGQNKVYETQPLEMTLKPSLQLEIAPISFAVDLNRLPPLVN